MTTAMQGPPAAQPIQLLSPLLTSKDGLPKNRDGGVKLSKYPRIELSEAVFRQGAEIVEKGRDPGGSIEKKGNELATSAMAVAAEACRHDDPEIVAASASRARDDMFPGERLVGSGRRSTIDALSLLYLPLQLHTQRVLKLLLLRICC